MIPILKSVITKKYAGKDFLVFAGEIAEQGCDIPMGRLNDNFVTSKILKILLTFILMPSQNHSKYTKGMFIRRFIKVELNEFFFFLRKES